MKKLFLLLLVLFSFNTIAQDYPEVSIYDIQFLPDSVILNGDSPSPLNGDTVLVTGTVMVSPIVDPQTDRRRIIAAGARWSAYIQDHLMNEWSGINLVQHDTTGDNQLTGYQNVDTADVIQFFAVIEEYFTTTQANVLLNPLTEVEVIDNIGKRPAPIELSVSDFMDEGQLKLEAEKYEGMYVVVRNVFTSDRNLSNGTFVINDGDGNQMFMYDQSGYFTLRSHRLTGITDYQPPLDGSTLEYIRGVINTRTDGYYIVPLYPGDIKIGAAPPTISNVQRDPIFVGTNQSVDISAKIIDFDGQITSAFLKYQIDDGATQEVSMTKQNDTLYTATIPGVATEESIVNYYIEATDDSNQVSTNPANIENNRYFYPVLDRDLTIQDIQYSPYGSGFSAFNGYSVTVSGVVTADTSDFGTRVYIQNGNDPWSGIRVFGTNAYQLKKGDNVTVTGEVFENFSVTQIGTLTNGAAVTVNSSGNAVPEPVVLSTGDIATVAGGTPDAEQYESMLIKYENLTVSAQSADGGSNFGEIYVTDGSGDTRVELEDGNHPYNNGSTADLQDDDPNFFVETGNTFESISGIMYFSFGNYKLNPRQESDFVGFATSVKENGTIPTVFNLDQNYPNPFNPTTIISYSLPEAASVSLKVFDVLGREVQTLVNDVKNAGTYTVEFNANNLPSGVYIYRIETPNYSSVKKMLLIK
ncbi:MAG: T9SS type A sorting domain-containing protein [Melioribacteraceae bacterium]|nr:T9SS type A sorting domain-containing protein [Melioribacteraceae bacterium]